VTALSLFPPQTPRAPYDRDYGTGRAGRPSSTGPESHRSELNRVLVKTRPGPPHRLLCPLYLPGTPTVPALVPPTAYSILSSGIKEKFPAGLCAHHSFSPDLVLRVFRPYF
jgi:hypothetical protein